MSDKPAKPDPKDEALYSLEVLCASWNPLVAAIAEPPAESGNAAKKDVKSGEIETYLESFYRSQQG